MRILSYKIFPVFLIAVFAISLFAGSAFSRTETIAVVVNDGAISASDLNDRIRLVVKSSRLQDTKEIRQKIQPQILSTLIEEELKLQEAQRLEIEVTQDEIENGFAQIAKQNNMPAADFKALLGKTGVSISTMYRQIRAQIAWSKIVQAQLRPKVKISDSDVEAARTRMERNIGKTEYRAAEIFLPVDDPKQAGDVRQLANRLVGQIKGGQAPFPKVAQQFSKSAGAEKGGDMGWVQEGQLIKELEEALSKMKLRTVSDPVRSPVGYHILLLLGKRDIKADTIPSDEEITNILGVERLERLQRRHLLDLKAGAFIENRV